ncbi:MAG: DUF6912 family protein [Jiangellaceae bacterium]
MRVYLAATVPMLAVLNAHHSLPVDAGFAVTDGLRVALAEHNDDLEELEYAAMTMAADASLDLVAADPDAPHRRVVVVVEAAAYVVDDRTGSVRLDHPAGPADVVSVHVDDHDAAPAVRAAAEAMRTGSAGSTRDEVDHHELMWFAPEEIAGLLTR